MLERRLKNRKAEWDESLWNQFIKKKGSRDAKEFYKDIADGKYDPATIVEQYIELQREAARPQERLPQHSAEEFNMQQQGELPLEGSSDVLVIDKNLKGIDFQMARCCSPVYGDDVFGFVTRTDGIKIHRITCPNAARLLEMFPYRIQKVKWADTPSSGSFQVALKLVADDESSSGRILEVIGQFKASIRSFTVTENPRNGTWEVALKLSVPSNLELDKVLSQLRTLKHVLKVNRL